MTARLPQLRILVCGTSGRGDDGAGLAAVAQVLPALPERLRCMIEVRRCPTLEVADVVAVRTDEACLVVDTVVGIEPGAVVSKSLDDLASCAASMASRSTHPLDLAETFALAETARGELPTGVFVAIGGKWFGYGERYSRIVRSRLPALGAAIRDAIEELIPADH